MLRGKRALVTGSSGFIGSALMEELIRQGVTAIGFDKVAGFDLGDKDGLELLMNGADYVFHLAVLPFNPCTEDPRLCIETNAIGTLNVVEAAAEAKVEKLIYSSASAVYGNIDTVQAVKFGRPVHNPALHERVRERSEERTDTDPVKMREG